VSEFVLDASAVLAFLNQETGAETIAPYLAKAAMSAVNLSEVIAKLAERGIPEELIREFIEQLNMKVVSVDKEQAIVAGLLRPETKALGLSLGDRMCLTLGLQLQQPVITTDRQWDKLRIEGVEVHVVR
jgi:PIN domain nuclease of toxin-antitoxin system